MMNSVRCVRVCVHTPVLGKHFSSLFVVAVVTGAVDVSNDIRSSTTSNNYPIYD